MSNLFLTVFRLSIIGSIAILCVILLNKIFKKNYSRQWIYITWLVIAIRLIIPINFCLINLNEFNRFDKEVVNYTQTLNKENKTKNVNTANDLSTETKKLKEKAADINQVQITSETAVQDSLPEADRSTTHIWLPIYILDFISIIWVIGLCISLLYHLAAYFSFRAKISRWSILIKDQDILEQFESICTDMSIKRKVNVLRCNQVDSPMLIGFIKPSIILPAKDFTTEQYHFIFKHELIHYKHHDLLYKLILLGTSVLHWFNPFIHYMVYLANSDIELYCDEILIAKNNLSYRESYSNMMLHIMKGVIRKRNILLSTGFLNSKKQLKNRFYQIMNAKPTKKGTCFIIGLVCLIITGGNLITWFIPAKISDAEVLNKTIESLSTISENTKDNTTDRLVKASNILVVGVDGTSKENNLRADSIVVVRVNPKTNSIALISFLRDMYLPIPSHGRNKLSNAYECGGADLIKNTLEANFDLIIDDTITVYMDTFMKVINLIGGVDIKLSEKEAEYLNNTNYISIKKYRNVIEGIQKLNGNQALGYLRVRKIPTLQGETGDFGRTTRLRNLLTCVIKECSKKSIIDLTKIIVNVIPSVSTDMNFQQIIIYLNTVLQGKINTDTFVIPVDNSYTEKVQNNMSVLAVDLKKNKEMLQQLIN